MWVADMDFETPAFIREVITARAAHSIYGYSFRSESYAQSVVDWVKRRHNWEIEKEWIVFSPGIVPALNLAVQAFTQPGDGVLVQPPVYFPFFRVVEHHGCKLLQNQLLRQNRAYTVDFDDFEQKARQAKIFLLSSPHNPVGKCFTRDELRKMGEICLANEVLIVSDEIHNDLILPGFKHNPLASLSGALAGNTLTCIAPSKTFNLAGLSTSSVIIPDEKLRKRFSAVLESFHLNKGNLFGAVASLAAYTRGDEWVDQLMEYLYGNFQLLDSFFKNELPLLRLSKAEATYLAWIDFSKTGLTDDEIREKLIFEAGLGLSHGPIFGKGGEGFQRMNLATPRAIVRQALERLKKTFG